jgi:hypothetical protein
MKKGFLLKLLLTLVSIFFGYILFILYITSGDTKHYEEECASFVPPLESYRKEHGSYPSNLELKDSITTLEECGYQVLEDGTFRFYFSEGLGVGGYSSVDGQWWHD